jgi:MFS superfamily sulfate permease-like transporter
MPDILKTLRHDLPASAVVFFIAVPLCLGISLASGAPLFAGLLSGILGGIVAGSLSRSPIAVSGPAAGMASVVLLSIRDIGSYQGFLVALVLAGVFQIVLGYVRAGVLGHFIPSAVIKGMLAGIGLLFLFKQIPHAFGDDADFVGDENFFQEDKHNTFTEIIAAVSNVLPSALLISTACIFLMLAWRTKTIQKITWLSVIPAPLLVVCFGMLLNYGVGYFFPSQKLLGDHLVSLPNFALSAMFIFPDWTVLGSQAVYNAAILLTLVASTETLLSIEAADKIDPYKRITPVNRELKTQGITNILCGLLGALPVTAVVVQTSANVDAGAKSKASTITHGTILALSVIVFPFALNAIPLASLAAILLIYGYKLTSPVVWRNMWSDGITQFLPFAATAFGIVFTNLMMGVFIGLLVAVFFVLKSNFQSAMLRVNNGDSYLIKFTKDVSFFNKSTLVKNLETIPNNSTLLLEGSQVRFFDHDIIELISDFQKSAQVKNITVEIKKTRHALHPFFKEGN